MLDEDFDDMDETKRQTRNRNEKKRRDQFNMLVNELSAMVCSGNKKIDKSSVLKNAISYLKNHNEVVERSRQHDIGEEWKPAFLSNGEFTFAVMEALDGFLIVFSEAGTIYYASEGITSLLGHLPEDVVKISFADLVAEDERHQIQLLLDHADNGNEVKFQCRIRKRPLNLLEEPVFLQVQFTGYIQSNKNPLSGAPNFVLQSEDCHDNLLLVCAGRLAHPQILRDSCLEDGARREFSSRHSLEWKFLFLDHRAPPIIGYLPFEVLGTSGYDYYHFDDLEKIVECHQSLMRTGALTSGFYRFLTKGHQWIWLQTCFYITYHQWNSKPEFIMCTHRVVSYNDVLKDSIQQSHKEAERRRERRRGKKLRAGGHTEPRDPRDVRDPGMLIKVPQAPCASLPAVAAVGSDIYRPPFDLPVVTALPVANHFHMIEDGVGLEGNNQVYMQEQLQRKHQQLQQLIVRQQEELKKVKQQLLFAKLGITQSSDQQPYYPAGGAEQAFPTQQNRFAPN